MRKIIVVLFVVLSCSVASANEYGIYLAPGEVLTHVDGVPVNQPIRMTRQPIRNTVAPIIFAPVKAVTKVMRCTVDAFGNRSCR